MKCNKGYIQKEGKCVRVKQGSEKLSNSNFFWKYFDFIILTPLFYSIIATQLNRFNLNLPPLFFRSESLLISLTILSIGIIFMFYRAIRNRKLRITRLIISILLSLWILLIAYALFTFNI